ncbi:MAG TPA: DUF1549 domain-containing protein, partial [Pirellulaceae bacterium]|nr:DUF1549 domain-containing protein [Pirellulaceae bacterium]
MRRLGVLAVIVSGLLAATPTSRADRLDEIIAAQNQAAGLKLAATPIVDDEVFLRRVFVDLIGRIPTTGEVNAFTAADPKDRREKLVEKLLADERFADRWTIFYADMLRLRS